ncbi:hypothetical protein ACG3RN_22940 [Pseudomonas aeruginosa]
MGLVISAPSLVPPPENGHMQPFDARTGEFFARVLPPGGFMYLMLKLHTDLFLGLPGYLFLGLMGRAAGGLAGVRGGGIHAGPCASWTSPRYAPNAAVAEVAGPAQAAWASSPCPGYWWSA